ncbi:MAG TPA: ATP-dependent endonuclease [Microbacteriaceae bacterium]
MKLTTVDAMKRLRMAVVEWAAGNADAAADARALAAGVRSVALVEGVSDAVAIETLAARHGRMLDDEGIAVVPLGGATSIRRFLSLLGPPGLDLRLVGLCDVGEERYFQRGLEHAGLGPCSSRAELQQLGFFVCVADLEDELIRALGVESTEEVVKARGDLRAFRTFQNQPAQRGRPVQQQLRRFMGTLSGRKSSYAGLLVDRLDLSRAPAPLEGVLSSV